MKNCSKKSIAVLLSLAMLVCYVPIIASATETYSGTCGENLTYVYDSSNTLLTITGSGAMDDYSHTEGECPPWSDYANEIYYISLPEGLTNIGQSAFKGTQISSLDLPSTVTKIGYESYCDCDNLNVLTIPNTVEELGYYSFADCNNLEVVNIPASIKSLGYETFSGCYNINCFSVDLANEYYSSDSYGVLFNKDKTKLLNYPVGNTRTTYEIPDSVTSINGGGTSGAFANSKYLTEISIPYGVTLLQGNVFYGCTALKNIIIPDSVTKIYSQAIHCCSNLEFAHIPADVTSIGYNFAEMSGYICSTTEDCYAKTYADENGIEFKVCTGHGVYSGKCGDNLIYTLNTTSGELLIEGTGAMWDWSNADDTPWSQYRDSIKTVNILNDATTIGDSAFASCHSLTSVNIPNSVVSIGYSAFQWDDSLTGITIPGSVEIIKNYAFSGCTALKSVTLDYGIKAICVQAFHYCTSLESLNIPDSVETIAYYAFGDCYGLKSIKIGNGVTLIDERAFYFCTALENLTIGNSVKTIGKEAFYNCTNLKSVAIPDSVTTLDTAAFMGCINITSATIGKGIVTIGSSAFYSCNNLKSIIIPSNVKTVGNRAFANCKNLESITFDSGVTTIEDRAFIFCESLEIVNLPDSLQTLGGSTFAYCCSLEYLHIPAIVTTIGDRLFTNGDDMDAYICSTTEDCYAKTYADENGIEFKVCTGHGAEEPPIDEPTTEEPTTAEPTTAEPTTAEPTTEEPTTEESTTEESTTKEPTTEESTTAEPTTKEPTTKEPTTEEPTTEETTTEETTTEETTTEEPTTEHTHTPETVTVPASCTVNGMKYIVCDECGEPLGEPTIIPAGHKYGEWETVSEATCKAEGKRVQKCTVCGDVLEEEIIPKLEIATAVDDKTGVELDYIVNDYEGEVEIKVEESFDGTAFDVIDTSISSTQKFIYDITMTVNGVVTQPEGKVTVKIPLPEGYDPSRTFVYHVDSKTGKLEWMKAEYINGFVVFETTHFSYYALVEVLDVELKINKTSTTTINYGDTLVLQLEEIEIPEGYAVAWLVEGAGVSTTVSEDGLECRVTSIANGNTKITAKLVDADENPVTNADGEEIFDEIIVTSKAGFFQKLISFFKNLFGINRVIY